MNLDPQSFFSFPLDDFQLDAIKHLEDGKSVVVCAPTGSGKTVVAEYAVEIALLSNKRCFYTTPLKALSNQKLFDLRKKFGDDRVGLLTGDVSLNREAQIVVMTTEVFRNMLYGTVFGDVRDNLRDVASVILDECHYMNDTERGTVWEESIIYAPEDIQLVALSATVANAGDLTTWIDETHGATELVQSDFRPVPLRFYYFGDRQIFPLLSPGGGINKTVKERFGKSRRYSQKEMRDARNRQGKAFNHPGDILATLSAKDMLPAIVFLFSRRGCEEQMKQAKGIPLLNKAELAELRACVDELTAGNPNLKNHPHMPYLLEGMAVHHAGMLPSWKGIVEKLFQKCLLKVVFATETLAAGINMPARACVISSLTKRADEGRRSLTASEFLQMSGRAGRRGMDDVGHVIVLHSMFEIADDAAKLATAKSDPLSSRFTPSYGMVLNLLERHSMSECQELIERSFGQFIVNKQLQPLQFHRIACEKELERLVNPLCPGEIGDLDLYQKKLSSARAGHKQIRQMGKIPSNKAADIQTAIDGINSRIKMDLAEANAMPCHGCPVQHPCGQKGHRIENLQKRIKDIDRRVARETAKYWRTFSALSKILTSKGYLDPDTHKPTHKGRMTAAIRGSNELFLVEVLLSGLLDNLDITELATVINVLVQEEGRGNQEMAKRAHITPAVEMVLNEVTIIAKRLIKTQRDHDIDIPVHFARHFAPFIQMWANGATWKQIQLASPFDDGDIVRAIRRTLDLARQFARVKGLRPELIARLEDVERAINRDEVLEDV